MDKLTPSNTSYLSQDSTFDTIPDLNTSFVDLGSKTPPPKGIYDFAMPQTNSGSRSDPVDVSKVLKNMTVSEGTIEQPIQLFQESLDYCSSPPV